MVCHVYVILLESALYLPVQLERFYLFVILIFLQKMFLSDIIHCANLIYMYDLMKPKFHGILREMQMWKSFFTGRAHYYDKQMDGLYNGPKIAAQELAKLV